MRTGCLCISIESLCHVIRINNIRGFFFHFFCFCFYLLLTCHMGWLSTRFSCHFNATFLNLFLLHCFPFACSAFISIHTPANQPCHLLWKSVHGMKYVYTYRLGKRFFSLCMYMYLFYSSHLLIFFFWRDEASEVSISFDLFAWSIWWKISFIVLEKKLFSPMDLHGKWKINFHFCCERVLHTAQCAHSSLLGHHVCITFDHKLDISFYCCALVWITKLCAKPKRMQIYWLKMR